MNIILAATKTCNLRPLLEQELQDTGLDYRLKYFDEHPDLIKKFKIKTSPLLIVNGKLISVRMPEHGKVKQLRGN
jgi:hypothetical protein